MIFLWCAFKLDYGFWRSALWTMLGEGAMLLMAVISGMLGAWVIWCGEGLRRARQE